VGQYGPSGGEGALEKYGGQEGSLDERVLFGVKGGGEGNALGQRGDHSPSKRAKTAKE